MVRRRVRSGRGPSVPGVLFVRYGVLRGTRRRRRDGRLLGHRHVPLAALRDVATPLHTEVATHAVRPDVRQRGRLQLT